MGEINGLLGWVLCNIVVGIVFRVDYAEDV